MVGREKGTDRRGELFGASACSVTAQRHQNHVEFDEWLAADDVVPENVSELR